MKLTCDKSNLIEGLNIVSKAISNRTTLPILECILLEADEDTLTLMGNDLQIGIISTVKANIQQTGSIAIDSKILLEIIRKLPDAPIQIEVNDKNVVQITCENSEFKIVGFNAEEYPKPNMIEKNDGSVFFQTELKEMIKQTIFSISMDEAKPILTGELFEISDNNFKLVAIDGYRISFRKSMMEASKNMSLVIPGKTMSELVKILSSDLEDKVYIYSDEKHILFDIGSSIIVSRLLEGEFLDYKQIFTEDSKTLVEVNKAKLLSSIERASLLSSVGKKDPIVMDVLEDKIIITSNTSLGTAHEELDINFTGECLKIAFNPKYLIDALKVIDDENVKIKFTSSLSPCLITPVDGDDYKYLILPVRIN